MSIDWKLLWRSRWLILISFALAAVISAISFAVVPRQWAAVTFIRVGSIGISGSSEGRFTQIPIEPIEATTDRMLTPSFIERAAKDAGFPNDAIKLFPKVYGGYEHVDVTPLSQTNLISLRLKANSREKAKKLAQAFVDEICSQHMKIISQVLTIQTSEINALQRDLAALRTVSTHLRIQAESIGHSDKINNIAAVPNGYLDVIRDSVVLQSRIAKAQRVLSFPRMERTQEIGGVSVLPRPVFPRPSVFVGLWILLGLAMSAALVIWRRFTS
ncbi:hypothetical protein GALL_300990 [mine drainage metagenome]|uniref:Polysaccharide chain length determinant N-terminal domain-containing protein n=1 Tax=mine drainage metagenome TaxID=410659 RepID=A0A1J5R7H8_9ZZZZ